MSDLHPVQTIVHALARHASERPDKPAIVSADGATSLTYADLWTRANAMARTLRQSGAGREASVFLIAQSSPDFAAAYFGTHLSGATAVVVDASAPRARIAALAERVKPSVVLGAENVVAELEHLAPAASVPLEVSWDATDVRDDLPGSDDLADLLFTSGTAGVAKGVVLTHGNITAAARQINETIGNGASDVEVMPLPLNHSFGLTRLRCTVLAGATLVLVPGFRLPGEVFAALERHRATGLVGVPAGFAILLRFGDEGLRAAAEHLRYLEIGSAPMPMEHKQQLIDLLPRTQLWMHYGLTEASRSAFIEFHRHRDRLNSIGLPTRGVAVEIRDESGRAVAPDEKGILWVRGPAVTKEYWRDPVLTANRIVDGWLSSGDVASRSSDGFLYLHGRQDDMLNVGGYKVAPEEVESALCQHEAIADAACVGLAGARGAGGTAIVAFVVQRPGTAMPDRQALSAWLGQRLEPYKVPTQFRWIDAIPRTESGKVKRSELRGPEH